MEGIKQAIQAATKELFDVDVEPELSRVREQFGDYATNVALQLAGKLNKNPRDIATELAQKIHSPAIAKTEVAGPGFINIHLRDEALAKQAFEQKIAQPLKGKVVVTEYSDPNPFKVLHAGHLYTSVVGDVIANLLETAGAKVHRVNFGGDVGLHVAKTMWAVLQKLGGEYPEKLTEIPENERADWLAEEYVTGSFAYGDEEKFHETAKQEIKELNSRIYKIHEDNDHDSAFAQIYWTTRQWSYDYFEDFYKKIGSGFEKYYPESETIELGMQTVKANIGKVFEQSDGAIVFKGEIHNLHTRVFINSQGLPTYETKDIGLSLKKWQDYRFDKSIIITANEIYEYMQVVLKAMEQIQPELAQKTVHLTHGLVRLTGGQKMSSRKGNILRAVDVLHAATEANQKATGKKNVHVELGAVKYAFLKQRMGADIIYDPDESVSLEGNSGPYLQYAHARARSILNKSPVPSLPAVRQDPQSLAKDYKLWTLDPSERSLVRKVSEYPEVVEKAVNELMPHHVCTYLYELAQTFNRFYENNRVIGNEREVIRLRLVETYADVLKNGLNLLNIPAPERM